MGYNLYQWEFLNKCFRKTDLLSPNRDLPLMRDFLADENYRNKKMLELGCQLIKEPLKKVLRPEYKKARFPAKQYFESIGINHISIDICECYDSLKVDLRNIMDSKFYNEFDIVTNSGTTEHVEPIDGQYEAFKNIHLCAKKDAVMLHVLPVKGLNSTHCHVHYNYDFFKILAEKNNYKIITIKELKKGANATWMGACFVKTEDNKIMEDKDVFLKNIIWIV